MNISTKINPGGTEPPLMKPHTLDQEVYPGGSHTAHQLLQEKPINESLVHLHASPTEKKRFF